MPIVQLILANLPTIISAGKAGYDFVMSVRSSLKQSGEWTDAMETAFQAKLSALAIDPAWKMDVAPSVAAANAPETIAPSPDPEPTTVATLGHVSPTCPS